MEDKVTYVIEKKGWGILLWFSVIWTTLAQPQHLCQVQHSVYRIPGDAVLLGFFGAHSGANCTAVVPSGIQMMQSVISAVNAIKQNNFVPGIKIGLSLYDTCSQPEMAQKSVVSGMVDADCRQEYVIGSVTVEETAVQMSQVSERLELPVTVLTPSLDTALVLNLTLRVLHQLYWTPIDFLFAQDQQILDQFMTMAGEQGVCIYNALDVRKMSEEEPNGVVVVIAVSSHLAAATAIAKSKILLSPLDDDFASIPSGGTRVGDGSELVLMSPGRLPTSNVGLTNPYNVTGQHDTADEPEVPPVEGTLVEIEVLARLLDLVRRFKDGVQTHCSAASNPTHWSVCSEMPRPKSTGDQRSGVVWNPDTVANALKVLGVEWEDFEAVSLVRWKRYATSPEKAGRVSLGSDGWTVRLEGTNWTAIPACANCSLDRCTNRHLLKTTGPGEAWVRGPVALRDEAWVAALLSVSCVGVLCCLAVASFIAIRLCKGDVLEGNPAFSFVLLFSLVLLYGGVVPFSVRAVDDHHYYAGILCALRVFSAGLGYSFVFSVMLARSLVLASCDKDGGLMSHVNGYLQTALCFFIALVQVGLTVEFWAVNWLVVSGEECDALTGGVVLLGWLSYDGLLLLLVVTLTPVTCRSRRNYREGAYLAAASLVCLAVAVGWVSSYLLLGPDAREPSVAAGLVATATVVLVSVFIPRTYLMMSAVVRDHIVSALPSLAHTASTSIVDINYRSTQALYDSVLTRGGGHVNPNFYSERPATPSTSRMDGTLNSRKLPVPANNLDNTYERYDTPPSPHNITRF